MTDPGIKTIFCTVLIYRHASFPSYRRCALHCFLKKSDGRTCVIRGYRLNLPVVNTHEALMTPSWTTHEPGLRSFGLVCVRLEPSLLLSLRRSRCPPRHISDLIVVVFFFAFSSRSVNPLRSLSQTPSTHEYFYLNFIFRPGTLHSWLLMNSPAGKIFHSWTHSWFLPGPLMNIPKFPDNVSGVRQ